MWYTMKSLILVWLLYVRPIAMTKRIVAKQNVCQLSESLIEEIDSYAPIVQRIINETMEGSFTGITWQDLAAFVDKFGPRFTGTQVLEDSIDYVLNKSASLDLDNVYGETVTVPRWVRYCHSLKLDVQRNVEDREY